MTEKRIMLVYQNGLANVFEVVCFNLAEYGRKARRLFQGDYHAAYHFALGMGANGATVRTAVCDQLGDITNARWSDSFESQRFYGAWNELHCN